MNFSIRHVKENDLNLINLSMRTTERPSSLLPDEGAYAPCVLLSAKGRHRFNVIDNYRGCRRVEEGNVADIQGAEIIALPLPDSRMDVTSLKERNIVSTISLPMGRPSMGCCYNMPFAVLEEKADEGGATVSMQYSYIEDDLGYPFIYTCIVKYSLHPGNVLEVTTTVTNDDFGPIPIADWLASLLAAGGRADDWQLQFHSAAIVEFR